MNYDDIFVEFEPPKLLKKEEFVLYMKLARKGDLEARNKVIIHNIKLVFNQVLKKFVNTSYEEKDLISVGMIGLIKAVDTFDITKNNAFSTYATNCINNEILMFIRKGQKYLKQESLEQVVSVDRNGRKLNLKDTIVDNDSGFVADYEKYELILEIGRQVNMLNERDKKIVKLCFGFYDGKQYSKEEIGIMMGLSRQYISMIIKKVIDSIEKNLVKQDLIEKSSKRKQSLINKKIKMRKKDDVERKEVLSNLVSESDNKVLEVRNLNSKKKIFKRKV